MPKTLAAIIATIVAYIPSWLFGNYMSGGTEIVVSTIVGLVAYAAAYWWLKRLRGDS